MAPENLEAPPPLETTKVETVAREVAASCRRAVEHDTPLFLLVFYGHENQKSDLLAALRQLLREAGIGNQTLDPRHRPEHAAGKLYGAIAAGGEGCIALLFDLPLSPEGFGYDPAFLAYLNLNRDRIARQKLRIVLLLPSSEAELFTRVAGDLWDFRQHTWWLDASASTRGEGLWHKLDKKMSEVRFAAIDKGIIDGQIQRVRALVARTAEPAERAAVLLDLANWLSDRQYNRLALEVALEGLAQDGDLPREIRGRLELQTGYALQLSNRNAEALHHLEISLALFKSEGDRAQEAVTLNRISQVYHALGKYSDALVALEQSLAIHRKVGNREGEARTLNDISRIFTVLGRHEEALLTLEQSLVICREAGNHSGEAIILNNIAALHRVLGRKDEALRMVEESLALSRKIGLRSGEALALHNLSLTLDASGREDEALRVLETSLAIYREIGDLEGEAMAAWNLGKNFERRGDLNRAIELLREAIAIEQEIGHPAWENHRGYLADLQKQPRAA